MTDQELLQHAHRLVFGSFYVEYRAKKDGVNLYVVKDAWLSQYVHLPGGEREQEFLPDLRTDEYRNRAYMPLREAAALAKKLNDNEDGVF